MGSHAKPLHGVSTGGGQAPVPAHFALAVAVPSLSLQEASRQTASEPANVAHLVPSLPSHEAEAHGFVASFAQAVRLPCGAPFTGVHVPALPTTSQA